MSIIELGSGSMECNGLIIIHPVLTKKKGYDVLKKKLGKKWKDKHSL